MTDYGFTINMTEKSFDKGLCFLEHPIFEYGKERVDLIEVPGSQGSLSEHTGIYSDTIITNRMEFRSVSGNFDLELIKIKEWIMMAETVIYSDMPEVFFKVKKVEFDEDERIQQRIGTITAIFTCAPGIYLLDGQNEQTVQVEIENEYSCSCPIYKIAGEGVCTLNVNGNTMTANVGQNLTIDTEKKMAYRLDGFMQNTEVSGDYEKLYLQKGKNSISISSGFVLTVIPNWRWIL